MNATHRQPTCAIESCPGRAVFYGVCDDHRAIRDTRGDKPDDVRFWAKVDRTGECWPWLGVTNDKGYGQLQLRSGRRLYAHRYSYEIHIGPIPAGHVIDHLCHTRRCVNPAHLRAITPKQNNEHRKGASRISQSGERGVYPARNGRWVAQAAHTHIGTFDTIDEAAEAVRQARLRLMTHSDADRRPAA